MFIGMFVSAALGGLALGGVVVGIGTVLDLHQLATGIIAVLIGGGMMYALLQ